MYHNNIHINIICIYIYVYVHIHIHIHIYPQEYRTMTVATIEVQFSQPASVIMFLDHPKVTDPNLALIRVQGTQMGSLCAFCIRNRKYGLRYMLHIWVLGPLGL